MLWKLAAPLRVAAGIVRDELEAWRLRQRRDALRRAIPFYSNEDLDRVMRRARRV
jgi:hypothetical protein